MAVPMVTHAYRRAVLHPLTRTGKLCLLKAAATHLYFSEKAVAGHKHIRPKLLLQSHAQRFHLWGPLHGSEEQC